MSRLITNAVRHVSASADAITLDASGNITFPGNATVTGSATGFGGVTEADQWRITSDFSTAAGDITANWERADTSINAGTKGTGMSQSSGIFTFPSTGWWLVLFQGNGYEDSDTATIICQIKCGSTSVSEGKGFSVGSSKFTAWTAALMDVTDTAAAAAQVKFRVESTDSVNWIGASAVNATWAMFLRLGDT